MLSKQHYLTSFSWEQKGGGPGSNNEAQQSLARTKSSEIHRMAGCHHHQCFRATLTEDFAHRPRFQHPCGRAKGIFLGKLCG